MQNLLYLLSSFSEGIVILGEDFNVPLNPNIDTSSGTSTLTYCALCQIKLQLQGLALHNTWGILFPSDRNYTFYSVPFQKYSRIDYFFLSQPDLIYLNQATIESMFISDHRSISITWLFLNQSPGLKHGILNPSLVKDPEILTQLKSKLQLYFAENSTRDISPVTLWEAHKCVIWGGN